MKIKTYRAKNLCEAFALIREELGLSAAILETREVRKRGIMGFLPGGVMLEVTASDGLEDDREDGAFGSGCEDGAFGNKREDRVNAVCGDRSEECPGSFSESSLEGISKDTSENRLSAFQETALSAESVLQAMPSVPMFLSVSADGESLSDGLQPSGVSARLLDRSVENGTSDISGTESGSIWDSICDLEGSGKISGGTGTAQYLDPEEENVEIPRFAAETVEVPFRKKEEVLPVGSQETHGFVQAGPFRKIQRRKNVCETLRNGGSDRSQSLFSAYSETGSTGSVPEDGSTIFSFGLGDRNACDDSDSGLLFQDQARFFRQTANPVPKYSAGTAAFQDALLQICAKLQTADMNELSIAALMDRLRNEEVLYAATGKRALSTDLVFLEKRLQELVAQEIQIAGPIPVQPGTRHVAALVGPTGVGKTTTIAKLAIDYRQRKNCQVGLITLDLSRMGAVEQLQTFADIINIPMLCVSTRRQMREAMARMADFDLVLIDTAGQSRADEMPLQELRMFFDAAQVNSVMLVLSSTSRTRILKKTVQSFESLGTTSLILTKLDEALGLGNLYPLLQETTLPVSYLTNGQKVPDDFETAERMRLARLILGDESCRP